MDLSRRRKITKIATGSLSELYPHNLQMYILPPVCEVSLSEFEELAMERLKILRCLELVNLRVTSKYSEDWRNAVGEEMNKQGLKSFFKMATAPTCKQTEAELQFRKRDHLSHFILRLAYCRSEDLRRWFIAREVELFRLRFLSLNAEPVRDFLHINKLDYSPISSEDKDAVKEGLADSTYGVLVSTVADKDFYRVPFVDVVELVRFRKVYLKGGFAYIPSNEFVAVLASVFRANLGQALMLTYRRLPNMEEDERLLPLLKSLHTSYTGDDYKTPRSCDIRIEDMDKHARTSFPLCMRTLHEKFRGTHHLRHGGRMQYGLFLKGIGVSLEDAMRYWREEFCKLIDVDKFEKQYSYNIRHNYGKEGKRTNYTPYSCMKIISTNVGPGDAHGCPFKHTDVKELTTKLQHYGIDGQNIAQITDLVNRGHYQVACGKYFEATHHKPAENGINHPNQYFEESQIALGLRTAIKIEPSSQFNSSSMNNSNMNSSIKHMKTEVKEDDVWAEDIDLSSINMDIAS